MRVHSVTWVTRWNLPLTPIKSINVYHHWVLCVHFSIVTDWVSCQSTKIHGSGTSNPWSQVRRVPNFFSTWRVTSGFLKRHVIWDETGRAPQIKVVSKSHAYSADSSSSAVTTDKTTCISESSSDNPTVHKLKKKMYTKLL